MTEITNSSSSRSLSLSVASIQIFLGEGKFYPPQRGERSSIGPYPEERKAENGGWVLGEGQSDPSPPARGLGSAIRSAAGFGAQRHKIRYLVPLETSKVTTEMSYPETTERLKLWGAKRYSRPGIFYWDPFHLPPQDRRHWSLYYMYHQRASAFVYSASIPVIRYYNINIGLGSFFHRLTEIQTRWAGQSPTWGRPAPQFRVQNQFE